MASRIEDYALIGDCQTAALVGKDGSIDWLCFPRFDSAACFAALLGTPENGRWQIAPAGAVRRVTRRYRPGTLILETDFETDEGAVRVIDFMPPRTEAPDLLRVVRGVRGRVRMRMELVIRFDYGAIIPWVQSLDGGITAIAGPDMLHLRTPVELRGEDFRTIAEFSVEEGEQVPFDMTWHPSHKPVPDRIDVLGAIDETEAWWREWTSRCSYQGTWRDPVIRSLVTLKAMTYAPTGGIVAAPTTSLPEHLGGVRNWDYRYCWLRDSTFALYALMDAGYLEEARAWREWLIRAVAGTPSQMHIMYGLSGERRLTELELSWLPGYENSQPVRIGNGAWNQHQLDVFGEVMDSLYQCRQFGLEGLDSSWALQKALMGYLETAWKEPDEGIWEIRGAKQHFTHSKVMAWVAFDRAIRTVQSMPVEAPIEKWIAIRDAIHREVCERGFDAGRNAFVQAYDSPHLDASLLMIPLVGFLPATDPRVRGTIEAIERELTVDGLVERYPSEMGLDGLPPGEGTFLLCSFWMVDNLTLLDRQDDARRLFERLLSLRNDVGLLAEQYDAKGGRQLGNFPQAFSHIGLINSAFNLDRYSNSPAKLRHG